MATIVTNVKERLRSRSRHRYSTRGRSIDDTRPPLPSVAINGWQHAAGYDLPKSLRQEALAEPIVGDEMVNSPPEKELPQIPQGHGLGLDPSVLAQSLGNSPTSPAFPQSQAPPRHQAVPDRYSSLRKKDRPYTSEGASRGHRKMVSEPAPNSGISRKPVPPEKEVAVRPKRLHIPIASTSPQLNQYESDLAAKEKSNVSHELDSPPASAASAKSSQNGIVYENSNPRFPPRKDSLENAERLRGRVPGHRTGRSLDLAPHDPSPYMPRFNDKEHDNLANPGTRQTLKVPDNVRIPENFTLESYVRTNVSTEVLPAVTQELVHHQKTEIIQKAITRDIHIHHYYEYFQPIQVVEILPARHWFLDHKTGKKIEIPEPTGWKMPNQMKPTRPDTSTVKKKTRHYLVNDDYPDGIEEPGADLFDGRQGRRLSVNSATAAAAA